MTDIQQEYKGIRQDHELYELILKWDKRSVDYMESRDIFEKASKYKTMYENVNWGESASKLSRPAHLSKVEMAVAFDVTETGLSVATAEMPLPDIEPEISHDNAKYQEINAMAQPDETGQISEEAAEQADNAIEAFKEQVGNYSQRLQRQLVKTWERENMQSLIRMNYREKSKVGTSFVISEFDTEKQHIDHKIADITEIHPAPMVSSIEEHNPEPFIYAPVMTIEQVKQKYGLTDFETGARIGINEIGQKGSGLSAILRKGYKMIGDIVAGKLNGDSTSVDDYVQVLICWMPDKDTKESYDDYEYEKDEEGNLIYDKEGKEILSNTVQNERLVFPSGYKKVTIIKGHKDWILEEVDSPYERDGKKCPPVFSLINYPQANDFWGISETQMIEDLMMRLMTSASNYFDILRFNGNPILILPKDAYRVDGRNAKDDSDGTEPLISDPGAIWKSDAPQLIKYLKVELGFDIKWWLEYLQSWIDRITHMSDAIRGFNQYSQDSGKKIRELRVAALGTFKPKLDEQAEFVREVYRHWAWIFQNLYEGPIIQYVPDQFDKTNFEEFDPKEGMGVTYRVNVSAMSLLPSDPDMEFEQGIQLFSMGQERTGTPLISSEHLIELATALKDKQRAKSFIKDMQSEADEKKAKEDAYEQFRELIGQGVQPGSPEEEQILGMIQAMPDLLFTKELMMLDSQVLIRIFEFIKQSVMQGANNAKPTT